MTTRTALIPALRYQNAPAAIDFLCTAFGFERHVVFADEADPSIVHHAQLTLGESMIMLGSARDDATAEQYHWRTPAQAGGVTMSIYAVVPDPDAHAAVARAAGAAIIGEPHDNQGYPGRAYEVRDTEGHMWSFGSYDPWAEG